MASNGGFFDKKTGDDKLFMSFRKRAGASEVQVGFLSSKGAAPHAGSDLTVAQVAAVHEFGGGAVPERSFMRSSMAENEEAIAKFSEKVLLQVIEGRMTQKRALGLLGEFIKSKIQAKIRSNVPPPLSPTYAKQKGSTKTLIDTGQMLNSVEWEVK